MIFFAKTKKGVEDFENFCAVQPDCVLWVKYGVLSEEEYRLLWQRGLNVTPFTKPSPLPEIEEVACNLDTIEDHHPGKPIWVER